MAEYWRVSPKIWLHNSWDDRVKLLALYILTCPHRTTEGLFRLPKQYICADLGWDMEALAKPFARLIQDGFIEYDEENQVMFICKALKYQRPDNPNQQQAAINKLSQLPPTPLWPKFLAAAQAYAEPFAQALHKAFPQAMAKDIGHSLTLAPTPTPAPAPAPSTVDAASRPTVVPPMADNTRAQPQSQFEPEHDGREPEPSPADAGRACPPPGEDKRQTEPEQRRDKTEYTAEFEAFWRVYPRHVEKARAFRAWRARLREGWPADDLIRAAVNYAASCRARGTEERFIKHASTFLGPDKPFKDWLGAVVAEPVGDSRVPAAWPVLADYLRKHAEPEGVDTS